MLRRLWEWRQTFVGLRWLGWIILLIAFYPAGALPYVQAFGVLGLGLNFPDRMDPMEGVFFFFFLQKVEVHIFLRNPIYPGSQIPPAQEGVVFLITEKKMETTISPPSVMDSGDLCRWCHPAKRLDNKVCVYISSCVDALHTLLFLCQGFWNPQGLGLREPTLFRA